jgi:purine-binding chemotaxis protein CheW
MPLVSQRQKNVLPVVERRSIVLFLSAEKEYGVETENIKEVIYTNGLIPFPGTPDDIEGAIDMRGTMVPVLHLGKRLPGPAGRSDVSEHVLITEVSGNHYGILVDKVLKVLEVDEKQINRTKAILDRELTYIKEVCHLGEQLIFIVDLERLWDEEERARVLPALNRLSSEAVDFSGTG